MKRDSPDKQTWSVQGSAAEPYIVTYYGDGQWWCSCPGRKRAKDKTCKHEKQIQQQFGFDPSGIPQDPKMQKVIQGANSDKRCKVALATAWDRERDLTDWILMEKFDGVRGLRLNNQFQSRTNKSWKVPEWFDAQFPKDVTVDGEFWKGRGRFDETSGDMRAGRFPDDMKFVIFDFPDFNDGFENRMMRGRSLFATDVKNIVFVDTTVCKGKDHVMSMLSDITDKGAEGLIARHPTNHHKLDRSQDLMKIKTFKDGDATVVGHKMGKGKYANAMGTLVCRRDDGTEIEIGTGFTDADRMSFTPTIGKRVTYRYFEETASGLPRFPSYVGVRAD